MINRIEKTKAVTKEKTKPKPSYLECDLSKSEHAEFAALAKERGITAEALLVEVVEEHVAERKREMGEKRSWSLNLVANDGDDGDVLSETEITDKVLAGILEQAHLYEMTPAEFLGRVLRESCLWGGNGLAIRKLIFPEDEETEKAVAS